MPSTATPHGSARTSRIRLGGNEAQGQAGVGQLAHVLVVDVAQDARVELPLNQGFGHAERVEVGDQLAGRSPFLAGADGHRGRQLEAQRVAAHLLYDAFHQRRVVYTLGREESGGRLVVERGQGQLARLQPQAAYGTPWHHRTAGHDRPQARHLGLELGQEQPDLFGKVLAQVLDFFEGVEGQKERQFSPA